MTWNTSRTAVSGNGQRQLPVTCLLCGEQYPDNDAVWDHECPEWDRVRRQSLPTLASHRNIVNLYERASDRSPGKRLVRFGVRLALGDDADLLDAVLRMRREYANRLSRRIVRRGLVPDCVSPGVSEGG